MACRVGATRFGLVCRFGGLRCSLSHWHGSGRRVVLVRPDSALDGGGAAQTGAARRFGSGTVRPVALA